MEALSSSADVTIFGGSNGGGKTWSLLMSPVCALDDPEFRGVIFRRTYTQITNPGAVWDESHDWYGAVGGTPIDGKKRWDFPHPDDEDKQGAWIKFSHMQHENDCESWDGAQLTYIGFDQLEQFTARQFFYMLGRARTRAQWKPWVFASCNPAPPGHWLREFIDWWVGDDGFIIPERSGVIRYMFRNGDEIEWVDEDARREIPMPDGTVDIVKPMSVTFIRSSVYDNKILLENSPTYLTNLSSLGHVDKQQKLYGNWNARSGNNMFAKHQIQIVHPRDVPTNAHVTRYWDLADTEPHEKNPDPDFTAGAKGCVSTEIYTYCTAQPASIEHEPCGYWERGDVTHKKQCPKCGKSSLGTQQMPVLWVQHMAHFRLKGSDKKNRMRTIARIDGVNCLIAVEQEGGSSGSEVAEQYKRDTFPPGFRVLLDRPTGEKQLRASAWVDAAEQGRIRFVSGDWNQPALDEIESFPQGKKDQVDAISGLWKVAQGALPMQKKTTKLATGSNLVNPFA